MSARAHGPDAGLPPRPSLPPLLACALGLWAACAGTLKLGEGVSSTALAAVCLACALASAACAIALLRGRRALLWCACIGLALGAACGSAGALALHAVADRADGAAGQMRFVLAEDGRQGDFGASCVARTALGDGTEVLAEVRFADGALDGLRQGDAGQGALLPLRGEAFEATARLEAPAGPAASYDWQRGIAAVATVRDAAFFEQGGAAGAIGSLRKRAIAALDAVGGDGAALLQALVCGSRAALAEGDAYSAFKATGLAHLVAVSGAHLVIVAAFLDRLLRILRLPRAAAIVLEGAFLVCYLVFAGVPLSAVRAAAMAALGMASFAAQRRAASLSALAVAVVALVAADPATALSVSFALSVLSTLGIVLFAGLASAHLRELAPRLPRLARDALALTFSSGMLAVPLGASLFSQVPLISPVANVLATPLFTLACAGGMAATLVALAVPALGAAVLGPFCALAHLLTLLVQALARVPFASVPADVPLGAALAFSAASAAVLWIAWPRPRRALAAGAAAAALVAGLAVALVLPRLAGTEIVMLDVGQGDAFVIRSGGAAVLVDTGNQERLLREALARHGVFRLDAVVVTHGDDDHCGALPSLAGIVPVGSVCVARDALTCGCGSCTALREDASSLVGSQNVRGLSQGDVLRAGAFDLEVVWPRTFADEGGNADSLCLLARADVDGDGAGDWTALLVGDAEREQLSELIAERRVGAVDIYKVGHHGSRAAIGADEALVLEPQIALVSVGARNRYGHPAPETLAALEQAGARVHRTDEEGDVSCKLERDAIRVTALR